MESYENIKNKVIRDKNAIFRIDGYFEQNYVGHLRAYVKYDGGIAPIDDFFSRGYRKATQSEIDGY